MKTYLRYSISVNKKAPVTIQDAAQTLYEKCKQYSINETLKLVLMPIDSPEYPLVMDFIEKYREYAYGNVFYEHKYFLEANEEKHYLFLT